MSLTIRWGRRSSGSPSPVRAGAGGWSLAFGAPPTLGYIDPDTGAGAAATGWNLLAARRHLLDLVRDRQREARARRRRKAS